MLTRILHCFDVASVSLMLDSFTLYVICDVKEPFVMIMRYKQNMSLSFFEVSDVISVEAVLHLVLLDEL